MTANTAQIQLLRYAHDLQHLLQQHQQLQGQQQMVLQSMGCEVPKADLLPRLLAESVSLYVVTNARGVVLRVSEGMRHNVEYTVGRLGGHALAHCAQASDAKGIHGVLNRFACAGLGMGGVQLRMGLVHCAPAQAAPCFDALVLQTDAGGQIELYWFLQPASDAPHNGWQLQVDMLRSVQCSTGLLVANACGTVLYGNCALARGSGYSLDELLGQNLCLLRSGWNDQGAQKNICAELLERGSWSGTMFNRCKDGQVMLVWESMKAIENLEGQVVSYISAMTDLSQEAGKDRQSQQLARLDTLTALPNRRTLLEAMAQALAKALKQQADVSVLSLDLDKFQLLRGSLGHGVGDLVLQEVARRLQASASSSDLLARVSGDTFVVVLTDPSRARRAADIAREITQAINAPLFAGTHNLVLTANIGCTRYPRDGGDARTLVRNAEAAMYEARRRNLSFARYDVDHDLHARPNLEHDIWKALERGELHLQFQPQLQTVGARSIRGCEALLRWEHTYLGNVPAFTLVAIGERNGAIVSIGKWVLNQACAHLRQWRAEGLPDLLVSVNVSLRQLRDENFETVVRQALTENALPASALELEFSEAETLLCQDSDVQRIGALRALGVGIAIDDFGISFSSLSRLHSLSISSLKINPKLVHDLVGSGDARATTQCLLAMGRAMGIEMIAQGVENADQAQILAGQGLHLIQGYFAARPMSPIALLGLVRKAASMAHVEKAVSA